MSKDIPFGSLGDDLPKGAFQVTAYADCENVEKQLHKVEGWQMRTTSAAAGAESLKEGGRANAFTFYVDEPPHIGGDGKHPQPLTYIAGGVAS